MHAGLSVLRRPAGSRWPSSATAIYLIEILGSRRTFTGCPSFGGQHAVGLNGWEEIWNTSNNRTRRVRSHQRSGSGHEPGDLPKAWFAQFCRGDHVPHASKLAPGRAVAQPFVRGDVTKAASRPLRRASTQTLGPSEVKVGLRARLEAPRTPGCPSFGGQRADGFSLRHWRPTSWRSPEVVAFPWAVRPSADSAPSA